MKNKIIEYIEELEDKARESDRFFLERNEYYAEMQRLKRAIETYQSAVDDTMSEKMDFEDMWNKLRSWALEQSTFINELPTFMMEIYREHKIMLKCYQNLLMKMEDIEKEILGDERGTN